MFPIQSVTRNRERIAAWAVKHRLPAISGWAQFAEGGNLMSYGPNLREAARRLAVFVDKILKGARRDRAADRADARRSGDRMIARRAFLTGVTAFLATRGDAEAQPGGTVHRIGFLGNSTAALEANLVGPFREGLRGLGYVEGRNIVIEYRWAAGKYERFPALIAELIGQKVDVIVTAGTPATLAVKKATSSIPLVMIAVGDPVGTGIVPSLARPGGNITGLTSISTEMDAKRLELLRELMPTLSHVAVLWNAASPLQALGEKQTQEAARLLRIKVLSLGVRTKEEIDEALATIVKERPGALLVLADRLFLHHRAYLMDFATRHRLPGVHAYRELVEAGGLMSFGPSYADMHRRAAYFVDRILKGARPADLPVERPAAFEMVLNVKAARALGLTIPQAVLLRATEIIE